MVFKVFCENGFFRWINVNKCGVFDFREELKLYGWLNLVNIFIVYVLMVVVYYLLLIYIMFVVVNEWMVF